MVKFSFKITMFFGVFAVSHFTSIKNKLFNSMFDSQGIVYIAKKVQIKYFVKN